MVVPNSTFCFTILCCFRKLWYPFLSATALCRCQVYKYVKKRSGNKQCWSLFFVFFFSWEFGTLEILISWVDFQCLQTAIFILISSFVFTLDESLSDTSYSTITRKWNHVNLAFNLVKKLERDNQQQPSI